MTQYGDFRPEVGRRGADRLDGRRPAVRPGADRLRHGAARRAACVVALLAAAGVVTPAPVAAQEAHDLSAFHWMAGCWSGTLSNGALYEEWWMPEAGGMMPGMARMTRDGRALSFESMRIVLDGDTPVYVAQPAGSEPTMFRLARLQDGRAFFENPEHDFPQTIIYSRPDADAPFARIEGRRDGAVRGLDFPLVRVACTE